MHDELVVANFEGDSITVYPRTADGNTPPLRSLQGPATGLDLLISVTVDLVHDELLVANRNGFIRVYPRTATGNVAPVRSIQGPATGFHGLAADLVHDELVASDAINNTILVYARTATGTPAPLRTLQGPATELSGPESLTLDLAADELIVSSVSDRVTVYLRTATGDVAPLRELSGAATGLIQPYGVAVDSVAGELLVANSTAPNPSVTVYPRTANGDVVPLRTLAGPTTGLGGPVSPVAVTSPPLAAAVLPASRSVQVGTPATAFAAIVNAGSGPAQGCAPTPRTPVPATFGFQTTDAQNRLVGTPNTPATVPAGGTQNFVFGFTPTASFGPTEVEFGFACQGTNRAPVIAGLSTILVSASASPVPDVIAVAATQGNNGIVDVPGPLGTGLFAVATSNVGAAGTITVSADTGGVSLPLSLSVCETDAGGRCIGIPAPTLTVSYARGTTRSFAIFAHGMGGIIPFDPASNRVFVRFREGAVTSGSTSVAVRTQ